MRHFNIPLSDTDEEVYLEAYLGKTVAPFVRKAILVIPGGAYGIVCADREGDATAIEFVSRGYQAFVLHYSVARRACFPEQLIQASLAMKHIKDHAEEYCLDPEQVFAVGFSAGGHLCATLGTLWKHPAVYERIEMPYGYNKPRGMMLIYPVISTDPAIVSLPSFCNLLGTDTPTQAQLDEVSLEKRVDADTAPAFLVHTVTDAIVNVKNALAMANACIDAGIPCELHLYPDAPHGWALGNAITQCGEPKFDQPCLAEWPRMAAAWADALCRSEQN